MTDVWEYKVMTLKADSPLRFGVPNDEEATALINREGQRGWELISVVQYSQVHRPRLYFKRRR